MYEDAPIGMYDLATLVSTPGTSSGTQRKPDAYDDSAPLRAPPKRRILPERIKAEFKNVPHAVLQVRSHTCPMHATR